MSMKNTGASGYIVKASELESLIPAASKAEYQKLIENQNWEGITEFLYGKISEGFPPFESVFMHGDEDESDDLERGEIYVEFAEEDLFVKTPTPTLIKLQSIGIEPKFTRWVVWG